MAETSIIRHSFLFYASRVLTKPSCSELQSVHWHLRSTLNHMVTILKELWEDYGRHGHHYLSHLIARL